MLEHGWTFSEVSRNNPVSAIQYLHQLYTRVKSDYTGRVTVPVLWDKQRNTIVSNESSEIIRMLNSAFDALTGNDLDFYPEALRSEIDTINEVVYRDFNNGVYRAGFATEQSAYERAYDQVLPDWIHSITPWANAIISRGSADRSRLAAVHHADPF